MISNKKENELLKETEQNDVDLDDLFINRYCFRYEEG